MVWLDMQKGYNQVVRTNGMVIHSSSIGKRYGQTCLANTIGSYYLVSLLFAMSDYTIDSNSHMLRHQKLTYIYTNRGSRFPVRHGEQFQIIKANRKKRIDQRNRRDPARRKFLNSRETRLPRDHLENQQNHPTIYQAATMNI